MAATFIEVTSVSAVFGDDEEQILQQQHQHRPQHRQREPAHYAIIIADAVCEEAGDSVHHPDVM